MQKKKSKPVSKKKPAQIKKNLKFLGNSNKPLPEEKFLIVCGEPSGDLLGANLIEEVHKTG